MDQKTSFLVFLPFERETWKRVDSFLTDKASGYWKQANANPYQGKEDLGEAVERLLEHDRPHAAIQCLETLVLQKGSIAPALVSRTLMANLSSDEPTNAFDQHAVIELIKWLQENPETDPKDLFKVEWAYLPLLDRFSGASPKHLEKQLAEDPSFFCEIIRMIFKSKREDLPAEEPTEEKKRIAENAYRLLHEWQTPPGTTQGAEFDVSAFNEWLGAVKKSSTESGHFGIAMSQVGQVLPYTPPDSTGLWIHKAVAEALNAKTLRKCDLVLLRNCSTCAGFMASLLAETKWSLPSSTADGQTRLTTPTFIDSQLRFESWLSDTNAMRNEKP